MHDREKLYRFLWSESDHDNVIRLKQGEIAKSFGISYQQLSSVMKEFTEMNMIEKTRSKFVVLYDPDKIPLDRYLVLRKAYVKNQSRKHTESGVST